MSDYQDLVKRLTATERCGKFDILMDEWPERLRNPDGPEAADAIEALVRERDTFANLAGANGERARLGDDIIKQALARAERAEAAWRPFAAMAEVLDLWEGQLGDIETFVDVADLLAARAVLTQIKGDQNE